MNRFITMMHEIQAQNKLQASTFCAILSTQFHNDWVGGVAGLAAWLSG